VTPARHGSHSGPVTARTAGPHSSPSDSGRVGEAAVVDDEVPETATSAALSAASKAGLRPQATITRRAATMSAAPRGRRHGCGLAPTGAAAACSTAVGGSGYTEIMRRFSLSLALVLSFAAGCGDDGGTTATTTGITSATTPGPTGDPSTGAPTSGAGEGTTTATAGETGSGGTDSGGETDTGATKLDLPIADFGGDDTGNGAGCRFIDVLFIVDISASMSEEKENLDANFPGFVAVLDEYVADPQNAAEGYRLGVTNSSIVNNADGESSFGLDGALFGGDNIFEPDCDLGGKLWIDGPGPTVTSTFSCLAPLPKSGCNNCTDIGKERPLDAIEMFIEKSAAGQVNEGFYRGEQALLVTVILTDEDDDMHNTTTTPAATAQALADFTGGAERHVVVTISGPESDGCESAFGSAAPAPTLHAFTAMVANGLQGDICQGDLAMALDQALALIQTSCDSLPPPG